MIFLGKVIPGIHLSTVGVLKVDSIAEGEGSQSDFPGDERSASVQVFVYCENENWTGDAGGVRPAVAN